MSDEWRSRSAQINPHTDPHGRCRYCGRPQPFHNATCRSLAAYSTERVEEFLTAFRAARERAIRRAALRDAGSSSTGRGVRGSRTWSLTGSGITASRRLRRRRSGSGSQRTPSTSGTGTFRTQDSWPSSPLADVIIGKAAVIPADKWEPLGLSHNPGPLHDALCPICRKDRDGEG